MASQRTATATKSQSPSKNGATKTPPTPTHDPFAGDFSQTRTTPAAGGWPVLQWHGGLATLVGDGDSMKINGGFFIEADRILELGLDPDSPPPAFERVALRLGGKMIAGWGASQLNLAFIFTDFAWEDRETGKFRFSSTEYERRKQQNPGSERELRGRTRALVAVRELLDEGVTEPLLFSVRGTYSASVNGILRDLKRMADEATRLRRRAGHDGAISREAFWVLLYAGVMTDVGEGNNTSRVSLPRADVPTDLSREFLVSSLVEEGHRRIGGTFDQWAEFHQAAWDEKIATPGNEEPAEVYTAGAYDDPYGQ